MSGKYAFVIMTKEKWWNRFRDNNQRGKRVQSYVRRGLAPPKKASLILFYVTKPAGEIAGYAEFMERKTGNANEMWKEHGDESVLISKQEYDEFVGDKQKISFIRFKDLHEAKQSLKLNDVLLFLGTRRLSRKGFYIDKETAHKLIALIE